MRSIRRRAASRRSSPKTWRRRRARGLGISPTIRGHTHDYDFIACYAVADDGSLAPRGLVPADKIPWDEKITDIVAR